VDERVSLPADDLNGARLSLRRTLVSGPAARIRKSAWGDPVLLWNERKKPRAAILISIDTLRADRVGLYGYPSARTPALDALGHDGIWYAQAYSPSTWTLPSHASLLFGNFIEVIAATPSTTPPRESLAEVLRAEGYLTAGFTGGGYVSPNLSFDRGFDTYFAFKAPTVTDSCQPDRFDGEPVFRRATAWLRDRGQSPFFLFVHTYEVHDRCPFGKLTPKGFVPWPRVPEQNRERLLAFYDDLIAGADQRIAGLLAELDALGLAEGTIVAVTSDHGEFFSEHGMRGHGNRAKPYEEIGRVPLIFRYPARFKARGAVREPVSLIDVAPTILSLLGVAPPTSMRGDVLPGLGRAYFSRPRPVYVVSDNILAVRQDNLKLITSKQKQFPDELYDLEKDPTEQRNLFIEEPAAASLIKLADDFWEAHSPTPVELPDLDPETKERLRALGYEH
jgi:arylsulfatase A-like enzyme